MSVAQLLSDLDAEVTRATTVQAGAAVLLRGVPAKVQAAVDAAVANGATAAQLAPVQQVVDALRTSSDDLAAALVEGTSAATA